jgi:hypothetical protein
MFFPVWWVSEERHIDSSKALRLKAEVLEIPERLFITAVYGMAIAIALVVIGAIPWYCTTKKESTFRKRIYID